MTWPEGATRRGRMMTAIAAANLDVLLAITPENAAYLAGRSNYIATHWRVPGLFSAAIGPDERMALVTGDFGVDPAEIPPHVLFPFRGWTESIDIRGAAGDTLPERITAARPEGPLPRPAQFDLDEVFNRVAGAVRAVMSQPRRVGVDFAEVDAAAVQRLRDRFPRTVFEDATALFDDLRAVKDPDEIAALRLAAELTEAGISGAVERLHRGMTEVAVNGAYQIAVHGRVVADPRFGAFRQAEGVAKIGIGSASPRAVEPGETIKFDMQVDVGGYHSDIGRTFAFEPTADQREVHAALHAALAAAHAAVVPGATFAEVHARGSEAMRAAGFASYSRGHLGHSVGLTQRFEEPPFIAADEPREIVAGMMLSLELPYDVYGVGAFQLERMLLVTADGHEAIDRLPFAFDLGALR